MRFAPATAAAAIVIVSFNAGCDSTSPKARAKKMTTVVRSSRERAAKAMVGAGLPAPPRGVDLLTGGNWGAGLDLMQAEKSGYVESSQVIWEASKESLRGMIIFYSMCLGERVPTVFPSILPPGANYVVPPEATPASAEAIHSRLTAETRKALKTAQWSFIDAYLQLERIGPFIPGREPMPRQASAPVQAAREQGPDPVPTPQFSKLEGIGSAWTFNTKCTKRYFRGAERVDQHFAGREDGTFWVILGQDGGGTKAWGFRDGNGIGSFQVEGHVLGAAANSVGLVVFLKMDSIGGLPCLLAQYDGSGRRVWSHAFKADIDSPDTILRLTSLPAGEVYAGIGDRYLDEKGLISFHSEWFKVGPSGEKKDLKLLEPKHAIQWLGNNGSEVFAVGNRKLYKVAGESETVLRPFNRIAGSPGDEWILFGDDGAFYSKEYSGGNRVVKRFVSNKEQPTGGFREGYESGFHAGKDGSLYVTTGANLVKLRPLPAKDEYRVALPKGMPGYCQVQSLARGLFVLDNIGAGGRFTVVKLV